VVLTHLHFDHCGGNTKRKEKGEGFEPTFPNALYWMGLEQYNHALNPNAREKASFFKHMILPVKDSGQLILVNREGEIAPGVSIRFYNGHTIGQMIPFINYNGKTVVYLGDLMPAAAHIPLAWIISYDMRPEQTLEEKAAFLKEALEKEPKFHKPYLETTLVHNRETNEMTLRAGHLNFSYYPLKKDGTPARRKEKSYIMFTHCPFCGEKY